MGCNPIPRRPWKYILFRSMAIVTGMESSQIFNVVAIDKSYLPASDLSINRSKCAHVSALLLYCMFANKRIDTDEKLCHD